jgi:glucosamine--fructose-6-phosphate aminotransferase (isomerizing)
MLDDILETAQVMRKLLNETLKDNGDINLPSLNKKFEGDHKFAGKSAVEVMADCRPDDDGGFNNKITIIGCGTSWHVALLAEYLIESIARVPVEVAYASEYRYKTPLHNKGDVLIAVSSSGETSDTLESVKNLKSVGCEVLTIAAVNEAGTPLESECDAVIAAQAGKEIGIASTKVFSSTALSFALLAIAIGDACGTLEKAERDKLITNARELPDIVQSVLDKEAKAICPDDETDTCPLKSQHLIQKRDLAIGDCQLWDIGCQNVLANNFIFLGRGFNFPIALEGAMKCKEVAYIHAEGYPAAEMKHGPIALIDQFMPVVCICPKSDPTYDKIKANVEEVKTRNGAVIVVTEEDNNELEALSEFVIKVPRTHEYFMPLVMVIPLQLLATMMGMLRGNEVDNPRGLEKAVSLERSFTAPA